MRSARPEVTTEGEGDTTRLYSSFGSVSELVDGNGHSTLNTYDDNYRVEVVEDEIGKKVHYAYDGAWRTRWRCAVFSAMTSPFQHLAYAAADLAGVAHEDFPVGAHGAGEGEAAGRQDDGH